MSDDVWVLWTRHLFGCVSCYLATSDAGSDEPVAACDEGEARLLAAQASNAAGGDVVDEKFEKLAEDAIDKAQKVRCSKSAYVSGLEAMLSRVREELAAAKETLGDEESDESDDDEG